MGTLEQLSNAVGTALAALSDDLSPDRLPVFLVELGLDDVVDLSGDPAFQAKLTDAARALEGLLPRLDALSDAFAAGDDALSIQRGADLLAAIPPALQSVDAAATELKRALASGGLA